MNLEENYYNLAGVSAEELYDTAPCGYLSFVDDGTLVMINKTLLTWLGYEREEVLYKLKFQQLLTIGGRIYFETHFFPLISMQGFVKEINFDLQRKNKTALPILLNVNEVPAPAEKRTVYRATLFDITDRKQYEKELLDARKKAEAAASAKADLLATISHEIRTPLNAVIGIANLLHNTPLNKQQQEYARILKLSSDGLLGLVNDILDLSKIEKGKAKLEEKVFSVQEVASSVIHTLKHRAAEKNIQLLLALDQNLPDYCIGDPLKLQQILLNLAGNAVKFTHAGFVKLSVSSLERHASDCLLEFIVTDTGIGIAQDKLDIIFEEFSQASYEVNLAYGGTGLGLTISQKLLQLHGSKVEVSSTEGQGSQFSFKISYSISQEAPPAASDIFSDAEKNMLGNISILVVDDSPLNITIVEEYLRAWNLPCHKAGSGSEALDVVKQQHFDLLLMDLQMPIMNGFKTTAAIRQLPLEKQPLIIAFSASARGDISEELKLAGFNGQLSKPFKPADLYRLILSHSRRINAKATLLPSATSKTETPHTAPQPEPQLFDLSYYQSLTQNSEGSLEKIMQITINSFEKFREQFNEAIASKDLQAYKDLLHKSKMPLHYIKAEKLDAALAEIKELLSGKAVAEELLDAKRKDLHALFEKIIRSLKSASNLQ